MKRLHHSDSYRRTAEDCSMIWKRSIGTGVLYAYNSDELVLAEGLLTWFER